jgi:hypothetical protein
MVPGGLVRIKLQDPKFNLGISRGFSPLLYKERKGGAIDNPLKHLSRNFYYSNRDALFSHLLRCSLFHLRALLTES